MVNRLGRRLFLGAMASAVCRAFEAQEDAEAIYQRNDWFALRRRIGPGSPALHRAAVATAFHRVKEAESLLKPIIRAGGAPAVDASEHLINLNMRMGKFRAALQATEAGLRLAPDKPDFRNARELFLGLAQFPEMKLIRAKPSRIVSEDGELGGEISINGHRALYFWDSGADLSVTTVSEVERLGLRMLSSKATVGNSAGGQIELKLALARRVTIGECELENVPFLVFRDDQQPFSDVSQEERGLIGLPVQFALGGFRWKPSGELEVGSIRNSQLSTEPNLCFNGSKPLTEFRFQDTPLTAQLDTGAVSTDLWPPFARRFPEILEGVKREKQTIGGIGQNADFEAAVVDRISLELGGMPLVLAPAPVYLEKIHSGSERYYANIGMELLRQAARVTLDFRMMRLTLQ